MKVVSGSTSHDLAASLCAELGCEMAEIRIERFPDGECYVRIMENLDGERVILTANSYPDRNIIELLLAQDAIHNYDIEELVTVIPYFGYARQDRLFEVGEALSAHSMARRIGEGSDRVVVVDIHEENIIRWLGCPAKNVSAMEAIGTFLAGRGVEMIISPDEGAREMARRAAEAAGVPSDHLVKHRMDAENVSMELKSLDVTGKVIGIVDDMISTGGTIREAAGNIYEQGAKEVFAACTHGLFPGNSLVKLEKAIDGVFCTDTLPNPNSVISVAQPIAKAIREFDMDRDR